MPKKVKKHALFPHAYDEISLVDDGAAGSAHVLIMKRKGGRSQSNPCVDTPSSTGAKDGKSKRSKNWKEEKHKRKKGGKFAETSAESKQKYGKGGTTKSKMDKACNNQGSKNKQKGGQKSPAEITADPETRAKIRRRRKKRAAEAVTKSSLSNWDSDAHIRALMERKAQ